jgi:hypothetical protein
MSLIRAIRLQVFAAAAICCTATHASSTSVQITTKTISCKFGIFSAYDANYSVDPEDQLVISAIFAERRSGNAIRLTHCDDPQTPSMRTPYQTAVTGRISVANACVANEIRVLSAGNWEAALAIIKQENQALDDISRIIEAAEFVDKFADESKDAFEKTANSAIGGKSLVDKTKSEILLLKKSGKAFQKILDEKNTEASQDQAKDDILDRVDPWSLEAKLVRKISDTIAQFNMVEMNSFSRSLCQ